MAKRTPPNLSVQIPKVIPAAGRSPQNSGLRQRAMLLYCNHPEGISVDKLHERPEFKEVPHRVFKRWAKDDRWKERRAETLHRWSMEIQRRIDEQMANGALEDMRAYREICQIALSKLRGSALEMKSWEGVARVMIELGRRMDELRTLIRSGLAPDAESQQEEKKSPLTPEEEDAAIAAILAARRGTIEAKEADEECRTVISSEHQTESLEPQTDPSGTC